MRVVDQTDQSECSPLVSLLSLILVFIYYYWNIDIPRLIGFGDRAKKNY